jgi:hypothetical protein
MGGWSKTVPVTGSYIVDIPTIYGDNWNAIENILGVEHYTFTDVLSGRHKPGITPAMGSAATSAITAVTLPATGALYQDTTLGMHKVYDGSTWQQINLLAHSQVSAYRNTDYLVTTGTTAVIPFDTEQFDTLSEYDASSYVFVAKTAGFYYVRLVASFTAIGGIEIGVQIAQYNSSDALINNSTYLKYTLSADEISTGTTVLFSLSAGDKIKTWVWHNRTTSIVLEGGSDRNFIHIYRLS